MYRILEGLRSVWRWIVNFVAFILVADILFFGCLWVAGSVKEKHPLTAREYSGYVEHPDKLLEGH